MLIQCESNANQMHPQQGPQNYQFPQGYVPQYQFPPSISYPQTQCQQSQPQQMPIFPYQMYAPQPQPQPQPQQVQTDELDEDEISDDEDDTVYFMYKGKQMGYDEENTLFLIEETGPSIVGTWDPETEQPVFDEGKEP